VGVGITVELVGDGVIVVPVRAGAEYTSIAFAPPQISPGEPVHG
jgi:hypothetical protein